MDNGWFVSVREPNAGEVRPGLSGIRIATDVLGNRWVLRDGHDEVAAYAVAAAVFDGIVPLTVQYDEHRSAQMFVDGRTADELGPDLYMAVRSSERAILDIANMVVMDYVVGNSDRHSNNWLVTADGRVAAIDNTVGAERITLRQALRPAYRALLVDDPDYTPTVIEGIMQALSRFVQITEDMAAIHDALTDVGRWRHDLKYVRGI